MSNGNHGLVGQSGTKLMITPVALSTRTFCNTLSIIGKSGKT